MSPIDILNNEINSIKNIEVKNATTSHIKSVISKLCKFFKVSPKVIILPNRVEIYFSVKLKSNVVFYNDSMILTKELLAPISDIENKYLIGIKSRTNPNRILNIDDVKLALIRGTLKNEFRTEINDYVIKSYLTLETNNLNQTNNGLVYSESDKFTQVKKYLNKETEGLYEEYVNSVLLKTREYENSLGNDKISVSIHKQDNRIYYKKFCNGISKSGSYARYKLSRHLKRDLDKEEEVDHIDGNILNNDLSNLRIISKEKNISQSKKENTHSRNRFTSEETRAKISKIHKGKTVSEEAKAKMRLAKVGYRPSDEVIKKMREGREKMIYTEEYRKNLSERVKKTVLNKILNNKVHGRGKLTLTEVTAYRILHSTGKMTSKEIQEQTGLNQSSVTRFLNRTTFNV